MDSKSFIKNHALVKITVVYIAGILLMDFTGDLKTSFFILAALLILCLTGYFYFHFFRPYLKFLVPAGLLYITILFAGCFNRYLSDIFNLLPEGEAEYSAIAFSQPQRGKNTTRIDCIVQSYRTENDTVHLKEKVRLYLDNHSSAEAIKTGDLLEFKASFSPVRNPGNPGEFDFAKYLGRQGIHYSTFTDTFSILKYQGDFRLKRLSSDIQRSLVNQFRKQGIKEDELAILLSLCTGNRELIDSELQQEYVNAGAVHILSVSGLHVGILYMIISFLFSFTATGRIFRLFKLLFMLGVIWAFAFITGLEPSVLRASVMFSFFIVGRNFKLRSDSYTILSSSALIILAVNPLILFHIGFQFSYLAVMGIVYFQPKLSELLTSRNVAVRYIRDLFTVSFAAQLTTFPLCLYYFHQFPLYFWLTNLMIIPLVSLIMGGAIILAVFLLVPPVAAIISVPLNFLLKTLNFIISVVGNLPYASLSDIRFTGFHLALTSFLIISMMILISDRNYRRIPHIILTTLILFMIQDTAYHLNRNDSKEIIIYNSKKGKIMISMIYGDRHVFLTKGCDISGYDMDIQYMKSFWVNKKIEKNRKWIMLEKEEPGNQYKDDQLKLKIISKGFDINFSGLLLSNVSNDDMSPGEPKKNCILLIDKDSGDPVHTQVKDIKPELLILDCSLSKYWKTRWENYAVLNQIATYDLKNRGAYRRVLK